MAQDNDEPCVFCEIIAGNEPAEIVAETRDSILFLPRRQHTPGHTLVVPLEHVRDAADSPLAAARVMADAAAYARDTVRGPANILTSIGAEATQSVFHLHVHVVPRGPEDGIRAAWPWRIRLADGLKPGDVIV